MSIVSYPGSSIRLCSEMWFPFVSDRGCGPACSSQLPYRSTLPVCAFHDCAANAIYTGEKLNLARGMLV